ncbi:MAG TPA: hypothetical protein VMW09_00210 [Desulfatiglandales bacterium]|nr:hypothetical protein [Desulfatiglandales bacterium]
MKTQNDLREEIDAILSSKLDDAVKAFQTERGQDFNELVALKKAVESLEAEKAGIVEVMKGLNTKKTSGMAEYNRLTSKLSWFDRQLKGKRGQIDVLMKKLTEIEVDPKTLTLILAYHEKEGNKK